MISLWLHQRESIHQPKISSMKWYFCVLLLLKQASNPKKRMISTYIYYFHKKFLRKNNICHLPINPLIRASLITIWTVLKHGALNSWQISANWFPRVWAINQPHMLSILKTKSISPLLHDPLVFNLGSNSLILR